MKILIAPDKMKGSISANEICDIIGDTFLLHDSTMDIVKCPLADGGDGTLDVIRNYRDLKDITLSVQDPLGRDIEAYYSTSEVDAYIELPIASGLVLLGEGESNPMLTSTYGTGQLMRHAIEHGAQTLYLMLGGSCTNDVGIGILSALGFRFLDADDKELQPVGKNLISIHRIDASRVLDLSQVQIKILCDVTNPLYGPMGAAHIFGEQKGANAEEREFLDQGMQHFARVIEAYNGVNLETLSGGGAAGGIGAGLYALCGARMQGGFQTIADMVDLKREIMSSDIIISGEGRLDDSSFNGKVVGGIYGICASLNKSLNLFVGQNTCTEAFLENKNFQILTVDSYATDTKDAMTNTAVYLKQMALEFLKSQSFQ